MVRIREFLKMIPGLLPVVIWIRTVRDRRRESLVTCNLNRFRNIHRDQPAWIIGNGPSLTMLDLSLLKNQITFGVNGIWLLFDQLGWMPTYYVVEDSYVAEDNAEAIGGIHGPVKIFPSDLHCFLKPDGNTYYINLQRGEYPRFPRFSKDCDKIVYWGGTVTYTNLQLANYMGCNPIYLIGMDLDYKIPDYKEGITIVSREADVNHFHPDYFGPGKRWHDPRVDRMKMCLEHAGQHLAAKGVYVINATRGGKLEAFPRAKYENVVNQGGKAEPRNA
jgi:hypothetical protein